MNILLVSMDNSKKIKIGGKHIHQELLEKGWLANGYNVDCAYPEEPTIIDFKKRITNKLLLTTRLISKDQVFKNHVSNLIELLKVRIMNNLVNKEFDYISAQDVVAAVAAKSALSKLGKNVPIYLTLHGYFSRESINYGYFKKGEINKVYEFSIELEKQALHLVEGVITVDSRIKDYIVENFDYRKKKKVIFNAIDNIRFTKVLDKEKAILRDQIQLPREKIVLLIARRLVKKNGVIYSIKAMKKLVDSGYRHFYMCIVGEGPEQNMIIDYIKKYNLQNYISIRGAIEHEKVDKYYKSADIILMPSIKSDNIEEATSLSMLEGMACGKVVIASAIGGMKEVIISFENGILVEDQNAKAISESIINVTKDENLFNNISLNAYEYAQKKHGYILHSKEIVNFYQSNS